MCIGSTASLEPFWSIAVDLDPEAKIITLKDALDCFFAEEKVRGCAGGGKRAGVGGAACCSDSRRKQSLRDDWRRDARRSQPPTAHPAWTPDEMQPSKAACASAARCACACEQARM